ncbi:MAG TPA: hypothetical protein VGL66_02700 [Caulobacteraceae bacterium]|jgi:hypothetical protein
MPSDLLDLVAYVFGGMFLTNVIPHFVSGLMGRRFPSPFAKPPGKGQSSAMTNLLWGFFNLVVGYVLLSRVGNFDIGNWRHAAAAGVGALLVGFVCCTRFGSLNDGRGPNLA